MAAVAEPAAGTVTGRGARPVLGPEVWIPLVLLSGALGYPFFLLVTSAFNIGDPQALPAVEYGIGNFVALLDHLDWIGNTLLIATGGTLLGIVIGVALAWTIHRTTLPGRSWFELLVAIPYPLGPLVGALAWSQLGAPRDGLINRAFMWLTGSTTPLIDIYTPAGIIFVEAIFEAPVAVLIIGAAMQRMDPALEESSSIFGGGTWRTAFKITLPLMLRRYSARRCSCSPRSSGRLRSPRSSGPMRVSSWPLTPSTF
jgi:iron(III) transport system permease protein